jgi:glyoxylase-like metal-dependent hydrolase (beta-lactamase superfamily II)
MAIEQLRVGYDNFCYIIYDLTNHLTAVIDPGDSAAKIISYLTENQLKLQYIIATHYHIDHTRAIQDLKNKFPKSKILSSDEDCKNLRVKTDIILTGNSDITLGSITLHIIHTPGHTPGGICILVNNVALITGDTLFINDCGRTDLPGGSLKDMYNSLQNEIKTLPDEIIIYPGHDYGPKPYDTLGNQKKNNKTLTVKSFEEFSCIE